MWDHKDCKNFQIKKCIFLVKYGLLFKKCTLICIVYFKINIYLDKGKTNKMYA